MGKFIHARRSTIITRAIMPIIHSVNQSHVNAFRWSGTQPPTRSAPFAFSSTEQQQHIETVTYQKGLTSSFPVG
jgi:hypothetical protein